MLILPPGHTQEVHAPRRAGAREKWMIRIGSLLVLALVAVTVIAITARGHRSGNGCVSVTIPYALGGEQIYDCGARARTLCRSVDAPSGYGGTAGRDIATECRKAGLPVGPAA